MKKKLQKILNKIVRSIKLDSTDYRVAEDYKTVKKEVRPLKSTITFKPGIGDNRDISAI